MVLSSKKEPLAFLSSHQRAFGTLRLSFRRRGAETVIDDLRQEGCLKARFPRGADPAWRDAVVLNTSGGVAAGDTLSTEVAVGADARASVAAQAAERFYRALPGAPPATVATRVRVARGAALEWLPQETLVFDRAALDRRLTVELAPDAWFLGVEWLVFGRAAMGEHVQTARLSDRLRVLRDGRLILHDAVRLFGPVGSRLMRRCIANGARAVATLVYQGPAPQEALAQLRAALSGAEAGASAWDGLVVARILAPDGAALRRAVIAGLQALRGGRTLPRVWLC